MRDMDGKRMRAMEATAENIGHLLGKAIETSHPGAGFALMIFSFEGPEFTYISNAQREDMLKMLEEFIGRMRKGESDQTWTSRQ
jgi:hypothetical protein